MSNYQLDEKQNDLVNWGMGLLAVVAGATQFKGINPVTILPDYDSGNGLLSIADTMMQLGGEALPYAAVLAVILPVIMYGTNRAVEQFQGGFDEFDLETGALGFVTLAPIASVYIQQVADATGDPIVAAGGTLAYAGSVVILGME